MRIVVFWEKDFPFVDTAPTGFEQLARAFADENAAFASVDELPAALDGADLLVTPYGSAFPKACWTAFTAFLRRGGSWVNFGGAPVTRPVRKIADGWQVELPQTQYGKEIMIRHTWKIDLPEQQTLATPQPQKYPSLQAQFTPQAAWSLQVKLTDSAMIPGELGSSGTRNARLTPLVQAKAEDGCILAAPVVALDQQHGPFMGGRWVLACCQTNEPFSAEFISELCGLAAGPHVNLEVRPGFACYYQGERPTLIVRAACEEEVYLQVRVRVIDEQNSSELFAEEFAVKAGPTDAYLSTPPIEVANPGLYRVEAEALSDHCSIRAETGFWIYDEEFMASASPLSVNNDFFVRDGKAYPVTGTTYMSTVSHRSWLFEPSVAAWDRDFAAMKAAGINMVRTGLWMAYRRAMLDVGAMDEAVVRSLQSFLLTARKHDIPVIFTCFSFIPESWNRPDHYLDPSAVRAQSSFVAALSERLAPANHLLWDFINEPSVASPEHLWMCRPNYSDVERTAWAEWLAEQELSDDEWRERWRLTPNDPLDMPAMEDFQDGHNQDEARSMRVVDYVRFAQDVFARWSAKMTQVIRANGNQNQLVTVGQDEGGTRQDPNPLLHGHTVDFTSNHTWWQNDDLLWDVVMTKLQDRPNLAEETGIMFAEAPDGLPARSPEFVRDLLERKMTLSYACGCGGFVQWLWNTCVYNNSDNEAGIGMLRDDGSEKPELNALRHVAKFMAANGHRMVGRKPERAVMINPHSNLFSVRNTADFSTRRCVRTLEYRLGIACRSASEYHPEQIADASLIVLPSVRVLTEECWQTILQKVEAGATLLATGYIESDEYRRHVPRLQQFGLSTQPWPLMHEEAVEIGSGQESVVLKAVMPTQEGDPPRLEKAVGEDGEALPLSIYEHGSGQIVYCPVPIEHARAEEHTEFIYKIAAGIAGLQCGKPKNAEPAPGVLVRAEEFSDCTLFLAVNESNIDQTAIADGAALSQPRDWTVRLEIPAGRAMMAFVENATGEVLDMYQPQD